MKEIQKKANFSTPSPVSFLDQVKPLIQYVKSIDPSTRYTVFEIPSGELRLSVIVSLKIFGMGFKHTQPLFPGTDDAFERIEGTITELTVFQFIYDTINH